MPLPLFFHLAIILWRKLELVKLLSAALRVLDSHNPSSSSHWLALHLLVAAFSPLLFQFLRHVGVVFILVSGWKMPVTCAHLWFSEQFRLKLQRLQAQG